MPIFDKIKCKIRAAFEKKDINIGKTKRLRIYLLKHQKLFTRFI